MAHINVNDKMQFPHACKIELHYNAQGELIWIVYTFDNGEEYRQHVTDDNYAGSTGWGDISTTKTFDSWIKQ